MITDEWIAVRLPSELPVLTPNTSRILLAILVELTELEVLDGPPEGGDDDC
ncbi:hypothetical protein [Umezawaea beigongshangensis]|uniref:hypothetical protein n=1 Tax=Umezawaea beigongshangensis TaxID=2780383 RepID=UPI0018F16386|nr:hypothetical protein [Umezawaea beigongshangensis]